MQYNYDDGENRYTGYGYYPQKDADRAPGVQQVNEAAGRVPPVEAPTEVPTGAPAERTDAPIPDYAPPRRTYQDYAREPVNGRVITRSAEGWHEPVYRQAQESMVNMYTPGICADNPYSNRRSMENRPERDSRTRGSRLGKVLRTVCLIIVCAALSGAATYGVMEYRISKGDFGVVKQVVIGGTRSQQNENLTAPIATTNSGMPAEDIYDMAKSQVVGITTEMAEQSSMFGIQGQSQATTPVVSGSGFIISSDGYILTNYHVIEIAYYNSLPLVVHLSDGTQYDATIIGYETNNDFAVIKIDATGLNPAVIGNSDGIRVGQRVYAVGNPFGDLVYTMTEGIVSALDRIVSVEGKSIDAFQFDAAVNSGNSGGPIYNANGEVIGIVTAKYMSSTVEGIGFAIPINDAISVASELIEHGYITGRPLLGITVDTSDGGVADFYEMVVGARVRSVSENSAAEKAGIVVGDIITTLGDTKIDSSNSLIYALRKYKAGDTTEITVWRDGKEIEMTITFDENLSAGQPQQQQQAQPAPSEDMPGQKPRTPKTTP